MDGTFQRSALALLLGIIRCLGVETSQGCASPQYLELGKTGTIICSFEEGFFGAYWYNSTDFQQGYQMIYLSRSGKGGNGYTTGEFDIYPNGSLLINNVTLQHDQVFTLSFSQSQSDAEIRIKVRLVVFVISLPPVPLIQECEEEWTRPVCFLEVSRPLELTCSVNNTWPAFGLNWILRRAGGDENVTSKLTKLTGGTRYTSIVTTNVLSNNSLMLHLLSCVADSPPGALVRNESYILVQNKKIDWTDFQKIPKIFERFSKMELTCMEDQTSFLVWKKIISTTMAKNIMYAVVLASKVVNKVDEDYSFGRKNSLTLPNINLNHKGLYACVYSNGISDGVKVYDVTVIVHPVPSYLVIEGCNKDQCCLLEVEHRGNLTCHVRGIFPEVQLKWMVHDIDESAIAFTYEKIQIKEKDGLFDVSLTVTYEVKDLPRNKMAVKCLAVGQNAEHFNLTRKIDLFFPNGLPTDTEEQLTIGQGLQYVWLALIVSIATIAITIVVIIGTIKDKPLGRTNTEAVWEDESVTVPLELYFGNSNQPDLQEKKDVFLRQLKKKYKDLYDGVRSVPYKKDEMLGVNNVFVDGVIESLSLKGAGQLRKKEWKSLQSYLELFSVDEEKSTRRILQGESGYGKSILCLQVAHDWCNSHCNFSDVDLLILLRQKQLGGVKSIYTAIKRYILPKDTTLNENDIKELLKTFQSVIVILDGFDEYFDQDTNNDSDVISIISRQMFQECTVVITTRSSYIPMNCPPRTKIYRLGGFDEKSRLDYIQKLIRDDIVYVNKIEQDIMEIPILSDLSQIPLLFAIFVNLAQESNGIKQGASVTEVFKHIISAFHKHTKNLMVHENVVKYDCFEKDHRSLDEICFQAVSEEKQWIVWDKDVLIKKIGLQFYKHYVRIGILVEEEVTIDYPAGITNSDPETKVEVSFVHKLFCKWYAAHYLRDHLKQHPQEKLKEFLKHVDPSSLQYVYRFACGLDIDCAKQLIPYLPRIEGGITCSILCIQEQLQAIETFTRTIEYIFLQGIIISGHDSMFLQRSSMKLLEQAGKKGIAIKSLCLYNCLSSVDNSSIKTLSGMELIPDVPVERLKLNVTNRKLTKEEAIGILKILTRFEKLKYVKFGFCLPPWSIEDRHLLEKLKSKGIIVKWRFHFESPFYTLNLETGRWEKDPDKNKYEEHARAMTRETEEKCKNDVENGREVLRQQQFTSADYLAEGKRLKHLADTQTDKYTQSLTYFESALSFIMCGNNFERDPGYPDEKAIRMYSDTCKLIKWVIGNYSGSEGRSNDKNLAVLWWSWVALTQVILKLKLMFKNEKGIYVIHFAKVGYYASRDAALNYHQLNYRFLALLNMRMYKLKRAATSKLARVLNKHFKTSKQSQQTQSSWNPSSLYSETPSPMSPTPSPAGSVGSVGSMGSQRSNSSDIPPTTTSSKVGPGINASSGGTMVPLRIYNMMNTYMTNSTYCLNSIEYWEQAETLAQENQDFFQEVTDNCRVLTLHSSILDLVQYSKYCLLKLKAL